MPKYKYSTLGIYVDGGFQYYQQNVTIKVTPTPHDGGGTGGSRSRGRSGPVLGGGLWKNKPTKIFIIAISRFNQNCIDSQEQEEYHHQQHRFAFEQMEREKHKNKNEGNLNLVVRDLRRISRSEISRF
jgi:hypothetical protein